ncbi:MAG: TlpA family protein disulfide reductase [Pedobacter sp.]|nr:TlpA family protein disulfide reductase [Pedobacter sp.]
MKKTIQFIVLAALCFFLSSLAQAQTKPLKIGDKVPDITINNIINYKSSSAKLSDFKGKLLILDFWATWCSPCVAMIPRLDSLQKAFGDKIAIISVTYQSEKEIKAFMSRLQAQKKAVYHLPEVVADQTLHRLFPHQQLPHYVWINAEGIVQEITGFREVNAAAIQAVLDKSAPALKQKKDLHIAYNKEQALLSGRNTLAKGLLYHSAISPSIDGLNGGYVTMKNEHSFRITSRNQSIPKLFKLAYSDRAYFGNNRISLEVKDPSLITTKATGQDFIPWKRLHTWCYELIIPNRLEKQAFEIMREDLNRFFSDYQAGVEYRERPCLLLVRTDTGSNLSTSGGKPSAKYSALGATLRNTPLSMLVLQLNAVFMQYLPTPLIDETGYTAPVDLDLNARLGNVSELNGELERYGLKLIEGKRNIEILVIRDREAGSYTRQ